MTMTLYECRTCHGYKDSTLDPDDFSDLGIKPCTCCNLAHDPRIFGAAKVGCEAVPVKEVPYVFESNNPFWTERQQLGLRLQMLNKPPLGLTPSFVIQYRRIMEIMRAIIRRDDVGWVAPVEWCDELRELLGNGEVKS